MKFTPLEASLLARIAKYYFSPEIKGYIHHHFGGEVSEAGNEVRIVVKRLYALQEGSKVPQDKYTECAQRHLDWAKFNRKRRNYGVI